jgi:hypothetical protein
LEAIMTVMLQANGVDFDPEKFFQVLKICEETGCWSRMPKMLYGTKGTAIRESGCSALAGWLRDWERKLSVAQSYEAIHGRESLLQRDDPRVIQLLEFKERYSTTTEGRMAHNSAIKASTLDGSLDIFSTRRISSAR